MIEALFGVFALAWVPWALSGVLVLAALALWLHFRRRLEAVLAGLDQALEVVRSAPGPAAFRDRFLSIHEALGANPIIGDGWRAFARTLVTVPGREEAMGSTRRPAEDLNESLLPAAGINLRFYTSVPNDLVGLGLLFTFIGLVAALYFASAGVVAADVAAAQNALRDLLAAATFKFVTSVAGLGASIVYSWREKAHLYRVGRRLTLLCGALEERIVPVTPEFLGAVQLAEMRTQTTLLRRLGRHLHVTVPETVEERLAEELLEAVQPMREGFTRAAARLAELDDRLLERLARGEPAWPAPLLDPAASGGLGEEMRRLREAIEALPQALPHPAPGPGGAESGRGAAPGLAAAVPEFMALFETSSDGIRALERRLERSQAQLEPLLRARPGDGGLDEAALAEVGQSLEGLGQARRELDSLGRAFREVAQSSRALLEAWGSRAAAEPELADAIDRLGRKVQEFNEQVRAFVNRADEELARSSRLLSDVVAGSGRDG